ncbi:hypothetical protein INT47_011401 [Mucor saturninus]|uniref:Restriction of telomere capping protein 5 n=1 Tax=Mucor saturninus TaxID=64648 RepID=A0A8H7UUR5_9FUNG|nr:hypothetical protein INT47_011401 [Mucor saturninus]
MGQTHGKETVEEKPTVRPSIKSNFKPKKHLTRVEIVSLQHTFKQLQSTFPDGFSCVEAKKFLEHLNFPQQVEPAAVLLFKSFSYLGSYPNCTVAGPVPLSFDAFITAFVVLVGRLDDEIPGCILSESLFFQSLSILPIPEEKAAIVEPPKETHADRSSKGLSLAELGVDFSDLDFNPKPNEDDKDDGSKILCRDLVELFVLLLWLGEADQPSHDFKRIRQMAVNIVNTIKPSSPEDEELPCVSNCLLRQWKDAFSPHLFKPLQSLITKSFTYHNSDESRLLPPDKVPIVDDSDILTPLYSTLISWALPETILITKQWTRLYSADRDGFSMNRFESHVFKYPGPTLLVMQVSNEERPMTLGAFITQAWKQSKHFWGSSECFLFELDPQFDIFRSTGINKTENYIYYHHDFGIGFGSNENHPTPNGFILYLQNTLQEGLYQNEAYPSQPTFESATKSRRHLNFTCPFDTENIEVFGLGNEKDRERQAREWKFDQQEAERRNGLNIRQADGNLDKELLKMAGIIDERQER